jgi:hypothetical protein
MRISCRSSRFLSVRTDDACSLDPTQVARFSALGDERRKLTAKGPFIYVLLFLG